MILDHTSRRAFLGGMAAAAVPVAALPALAAPGIDAELVRLGEELDRLVPEWVKARDDYRRTGDALFYALVTSGLAREVKGGRFYEHFGDEASRSKYDELSASTGNDGAHASWSAIEERLYEVADQIAAIDPRTPAGVSARIRAVLWEHFAESGQPWMEPGYQHEQRLVAALVLGANLGSGGRAA